MECEVNINEKKKLRIISKNPKNISGGISGIRNLNHWNIDTS